MKHQDPRSRSWLLLGAPQRHLCSRLRKPSNLSLPSQDTQKARSPLPDLWPTITPATRHTRLRRTTTAAIRHVSKPGVPPQPAAPTGAAPAPGPRRAAPQAQHPAGGREVDRARRHVPPPRPSPTPPHLHPLLPRRPPPSCPQLLPGLARPATPHRALQAAASSLPQPRLQQGRATPSRRRRPPAAPPARSPAFPPPP